MENEDGKTESVKYDGSQVSGISWTAPTTIPDAALYDVDGKPPTSATVTIIFENGKSVVDSLTITPEDSGSGAVGAQPVGAAPMPIDEAIEPIAPRPKQQLEEPAQQLEEPAPAPE